MGIHEPPWGQEYPTLSSTAQGIADQLGGAAQNMFLAQTWALYVTICNLTQLTQPDAIHASQCN